MSNVSINTNDSRYTGREGYSKPLDYYEEKLRRHQGAELLDHPDGSVTGPKIADLAVTGDKIAELTIKAGNIAHRAVQTSKIADSAITTEKIDNLQVTSDKLAYGAVKNINIGDNAVTEDKIHDKSISVSKLTDDFKLPGDMIADGGIKGNNLSPRIIKNEHLGLYVVETYNLASTFALPESKISPVFVSSLVRKSDKGAPGGVATLNESGQVPSEQLPSYVDDVIEGTLDTFPNPGESGKIYIDTATNYSYRWSGSTYVKIVDNELPDGYVTVPKLGNDVIKTYNNLIKSSDISDTGYGLAHISLTLTANKGYVLSFIPNDIFTYVYNPDTEETEYVQIPFEINGNTAVIKAEDMLYSQITIQYSSQTYGLDVMLFDASDELPERYKSGDKTYLSDSLLESVYREIDYINPVITNLSVNGGYAFISANKIYTATIDSNIAFVLSDVKDKSHVNQIVVRVNIETDIAIDWGTTYFYNGEIPYITTGEYEFIFSYIGDKWVAGVLPIEVGGSV